MSFLRGTEEYYRKFIELQEKLRRSEDERLKLEMKFNEMIHVTRDEEDAYHRKLRSQYQHFLEEDQKRQERNDRIIKVLERIENRAALLAAKTERFQSFRKQYMAYLRKVSNDAQSTHETASLYTAPSLQSVYDMKPNTPGSLDGKQSISEKLNFSHRRRSKPFDFEKTGCNESVLNAREKSQTYNGDLRDHPVVKKALDGDKRDLRSDLESLKSYLNRRSPIQEIGSPSVLNEGSSDSSDSVHSDNYQHPKSPREKEEDRITKIIRWRPKFLVPRRHRFQYRSRSKWQIPERSKYTSNEFTRKDLKSPKSTREFCNTRLVSSTLPTRWDVEIFNPRTFEQIPSYQDYRKDFGYKYTPSVVSRENDEGYTENYGYQVSNYNRQANAPQRTNLNPQDLSYQLSNYPNLDYRNRMNIEYTVYPKISEFPSQKSNSSGNRSAAYQKRDYGAHSPTRTPKVSWYDHYLGRCQPKDYENGYGDKISNTLPKNTEEQRIVSPKHQQFASNKYTPSYDSKIKQDSILLNADIRPVQQNKISGNYQSTNVPDQYKSEDVRNGDVKMKTQIKFDSEFNSKVRDPVKSYEDKSPKYNNEYFHRNEEYDDLQHEYAQDLDETEDQVASEVLPEDEIPKQEYECEDIKPRRSEYYQQNNGKGDDYPVRHFVTGQYEMDDDEDNRYYEEKHDSLEENRKENYNDYKNEQLKIEDDGSKQKQQCFDEQPEKQEKYKDQMHTVENFEKHDQKQDNHQKFYRSQEETSQQYETEKEDVHQSTDDRKINGVDVREDEEINSDRQYYKDQQELQDQQQSKEHLYEAPKDQYMYNENTDNLQYVENDQSKQEYYHASDQENVGNKEITQSKQSNVPVTPSTPTKDFEEETNQKIDSTPLHEQKPKTNIESNPKNDQDASEYVQNPQPTSPYEQTAQPDQDAQPTTQYDQNKQPSIQYEQTAQSIIQLDENGQPIVQCDENAQPAVQYDENGQPVAQYDQNVQPTGQYDENGQQPIVQYDENGQPIQYSGDNIQYDEHGQPIGYGDGQYYPQYDENGQLIQQYDESGQPIMQYDEHGQPIVQYDENGQPIMMYDENGQPLYQYDQYYQDQQYQEQQQQEYYEQQSQQEPQQEEVAGDEKTKSDSLPQTSPVQEDDRKMKVVDMLDTDTESTKQETKKSNDSDFDFSNK